MMVTKIIYSRVDIMISEADMEQKVVEVNDAIMALSHHIENKYGVNQVLFSAKKFIVCWSTQL